MRVARSDATYADAEMSRIDRILRTRYGLSPFEAAGLRSKAETLEAEAPDTVRFTRAIKDAVPYEDRQGVVEALWEVVLADGARDEDEDALLRLIANLLGVNDRDFEPCPAEGRIARTLRRDRCRCAGCARNVQPFAHYWGSCREVAAFRNCNQSRMTTNSDAGETTNSRS